MKKKIKKKTKDRSSEQFAQSMSIIRWRNDELRKSKEEREKKNEYTKNK